MQCLQNHELDFHFKAGKFSLWLFAFLQCSILLGVFASWFLYSLIRPPDYDWLRHNRYVFDQLAQGERQLITEGSTKWFTERKAKGHTYPYLDFKLALEGKEILGKSAKEAVEEVARNGAIMYTRADWQSYFLASRHCNIIKTHVVFPPLGAHLILPKNSSLTPKVNQVIKANKMKFGAIYRRYTEMISKEAVMTSICGEFKPGDPLKMSFFYGLFIVIASLFLFALALFCGEIAYHAYQQKNPNLADNEII
uniref:PBPe domain-containing protein n=2 Tax=Bursaphelenchus xylophilus TaxID=6326 RepID=A0A1I7SII1_BURXY